jgi:hypothetical protein
VPDDEPETQFPTETEDDEAFLKRFETGVLTPAGVLDEDL